MFDYFFFSSTKLLNSYGPRFIVMMRDMSDEERFLLISLVLGKKSVNASKSTISVLSSLGLLRIVNGRPVLHDPVDTSLRKLQENRFSEVRYEKASVPVKGRRL